MGAAFSSWWRSLFGCGSHSYRRVENHSPHSETRKNHSHNHSGTKKYSPSKYYKTHNNSNGLAHSHGGTRARRARSKKR